MQPASGQGSKDRWYLVVIGMVVFMLLAALVMIGLDRAVRVNALAETRATATSQSAILAAGLESELNKFSLVPRVLAVDPMVTSVLSGQNAGRDELNRRLAALAAQTSAAAIYLMNADGLTLAASNWQRSDSFIGSNYGFRSYFSGALEHGTSSEFALGTVSRRPGLYLAQRVGPADRPVGVLAVKVEFDSLERKWRDAEAGVFVTDTDGIILLASNPNWRFRTTSSGREASLMNDTQRNAMRFGVAEPRPIALPMSGDPASPMRMIEKIQPLAPVGWELHLLADPGPRLSVALANARLAGVIALGLIMAATAAIWLWQRQRQARAAAAVNAQTALLREQLQQANRLATLGQITAGLGHEIRQPLAAMRAYAENGMRLLDRDRLTDAADNFDKIARLAGRIDDITAEQLHFSRRGSEECREIRLADVIDGSLLLLRDQIRHKGLVIVRPAPDLAATTIRARHVQLEQVLVNLLQNAVQACGENGKIKLSITTGGSKVLLSISDNGAGVPADLRDVLFQPFVTSKEEGIGLGLAISHDIMRKLGGDLVYEPGDEGARFIMVMPAV